MKKPILLASALLLVTGCSSISVVKREYQPQFACSGDDVHVYYEINKKIEKVKIKDAQGNLIASFHNKKRFDFIVQNIQPEKLPLKIKVKGEEPQYTRPEDFQLFDNPTWSAVIDTLSYDMDVTDHVVHRQERDPSGQMWCYEDHEWYVTLKGIRWQLPAYNFGSRIRVAGIRNLNTFPVTLDLTTAQNTIPPGAERLFNPRPFGQVSVIAAMSPYVTKYCGLTRCGMGCGQAVSLGGNCPSKDDEPRGEECFPEFAGSIQLLLQCDVPGN